MTNIHEKIEPSEALVGSDEISRIYAEHVVEVLGKGPEAATVTHHDVLRAAEMSAKLVFQLFETHEPENRGEL